MQPGARPFGCWAYEGTEHEATFSVFRNPRPEGSFKGNVCTGFRLALQERPWHMNMMILNELCCSFHFPVFNSPFLMADLFVMVCRTWTIVFLLDCFHVAYWFFSSSFEDCCREQWILLYCLFFLVSGGPSFLFFTHVSFSRHWFVFLMIFQELLFFSCAVLLFQPASNWESRGCCK